jgi:hypothetical protein
MSCRVKSKKKSKKKRSHCGDVDSAAYLNLLQAGQAKYIVDGKRVTVYRF